MGKSTYVRIIKGKRSEELTPSNTPPHGGPKYLLSSRGGLSPPEMKSFGGGKNEEEKESVLHPLEKSEWGEHKH